MSKRRKSKKYKSPQKMILKKRKRIRNYKILELSRQNNKRKNRIIMKMGHQTAAHHPRATSKTIIGII
jgi:hypothetical protein